MNKLSSWMIVFKVEVEEWLEGETTKIHKTSSTIFHSIYRTEKTRHRQVWDEFAAKIDPHVDSLWRSEAENDVFYERRVIVFCLGVYQYNDLEIRQYVQYAGKKLDLDL